MIPSRVWPIRLDNYRVSVMQFLHRALVKVKNEEEKKRRKKEGDQCQVLKYSRLVVLVKVWVEHFHRDPTAVSGLKDCLGHW